MSDEEYTDVPYVGTVATLIEKKAGWFTVEIAVPGRQWTIKADTKLEPLLKQAREIRDAGSIATFTVRESESENINPNNNKPYTERRLQKVELGAQNVPNANVSPSDAGGGMTKDEWAHKDSAIHMMACVKTAAAALTHTMPADPTTEDLRKFLDNVRYLSRDWHLTVIAVRDGDESDVPFLSEHDDAIPY